MSKYEQVQYLLNQGLCGVLTAQTHGTNEPTKSVTILSVQNPSVLEGKKNAEPIEQAVKKNHLAHEHTYTTDTNVHFYPLYVCFSTGTGGVSRS